jgi:beta-glucosidase
MPQHGFTPGFLWGAATSSHQVEGGNRNNDWWEWEQGLDAPDRRSGNACDQWNRFADDAALAAELGHTAHRLSLEWSRIEPSEGIFDEAAIAHYHEVLSAFRARGMRTMLTLHHFTLPRWVAARGGWLDTKTPERFERFVAHIAPKLADLVDLWCTINEPGVQAFMGYTVGIWPPHRKSALETARATWHLAKAHRRAYRAINRTAPAAQIGIAHNVTRFVAQTGRANERLAAHILAWTANRLFFRLTGWRFHDWIGLNHYFTRRIDGDGRLIPGFADPVELGHEVSGLKWELRPESLAEIAKDFLGKRRPIYITEHGLATDDDAQRERFLVASLKALQALVETDAEARRWVRGYFHWSLLDNFEWADGFTPHFGLIAVNYATQARTPRPSALRYHEIIKKNAV